MVFDRIIPLAGFPAGRLICSLLLAAGLIMPGEPGFADELVHSRVVELQRSLNTRDIGGYEAQAGRNIRWGKIFRSAQLSKLTDQDFRKLESLGIRTVIDLRFSEEVERAPTEWRGSNPPQFHSLPIGKSGGWWVTNQSELLRSGRMTADESLEHFLSAYRAIDTVGADSYRRLFEILLDESNLPLLIHCSAGKDRTGVAVALIMESLGVGRETIMADFLLTNDVARVQERSAALARQIAERSSSTGSRLARTPPSAEAYFPFLGVKPDMLNAFYDSVADKYGSMDAYLVYLGVAREQREALTSTLTE